MSITVKLPDGSPLELDEGATGADAAAAIGPGLAKAALAIRAGDELRDLAAPLRDGEGIEIVTEKSDGALELIRHDAAHVMATAVCELWPGTKVSIGPPIDGCPMMSEGTRWQSGILPWPRQHRCCLPFCLRAARTCCASP